MCLWKFKKKKKIIKHNLIKSQIVSPWKIGIGWNIKTAIFNVFLVFTEDEMRWSFSYPQALVMPLQRLWNQNTVNNDVLFRKNVC